MHDGSSWIIHRPVCTRHWIASFWLECRGLLTRSCHCTYDEEKPSDDYLCTHVYVWISHVCMRVRMHVCMYIYTYVQIRKHSHAFVSLWTHISRESWVFSTEAKEAFTVSMSMSTKVDCACRGQSRFASAAALNNHFSPHIVLVHLTILLLHSNLCSKFRQVNQKINSDI